MRTRQNILLLGGTAEGRLIGDHLKTTDHHWITSNAGLTDVPADISGGFGGLEGLVKSLQDHKISLIVDATHPYASQISQTASQAAYHLSLPLFRLNRPQWVPTPSDQWTIVPTVEAAAEALKRLNGHTALVALGARHVDVFRHKTPTVIFRTALPLADPAGVINIAGKGPFSLHDEQIMSQTYNITCLVCKNSGGPWSWPKIELARANRWPVIMIQRPNVTYSYGTELTLDILINRL